MWLAKIKDTTVLHNDIKILEFEINGGKSKKFEAC